MTVRPPSLRNLSPQALIQVVGLARRNPQENGVDPPMPLRASRVQSLPGLIPTLRIRVGSLHEPRSIIPLRSGYVRWIRYEQLWSHVQGLG